MAMDDTFDTLNQSLSIPKVKILTMFRLGLFQMGLSMMAILTLGVLNLVMIQEIAIYGLAICASGTAFAALLVLICRLG